MGKISDQLKQALDQADAEFHAGEDTVARSVEEHRKLLAAVIDAVCELDEELDALRRMRL